PECMCVGQNHRPSRRNAHQRAGERCKPAEAEHDRWLAAAHDREAVDARGEKRVRTEQQRAQSFSTQAAKRNAFEFDAVLGNELRFQSFARAEPENGKTARDELRGDSESRKNMAARAAGGDHHGSRHGWAPTLAALLTNSAAALPPDGAHRARWGRASPRP